MVRNDQSLTDLGNASRWSKDNFSKPSRNEFFETIGRTLTPTREPALAEFNEHTSPSQILQKIKSIQK
jgi:hypothetical protein